MKYTFLLIYTTVSGTTYKEFKTLQDDPGYNTCVQRIIDEFDELVYLFLKDGSQAYYINVDHIESLNIQEVNEGQSIVYDFEEQIYQ